MATGKKDIIAALDIGTTKVVLAVAEVLPGGSYEIIGFGQKEMLGGVRCGEINNIEATVEAIEGAVREAERSSGCRITHVTTGISGGHVQSTVSNGVVPVKGKEISDDDIEKVKEAASTIRMADGFRLMKSVLQQHIVDGQPGVKNPRGMSAVRLEAHYRIVAGSENAYQNIIRCARRCGLEVNDVIPQPFASADAVLSDAERELGVLLVDIGGGTTDVGIYHEGELCYMKVFAGGGEAITKSIAETLQTPIQEAEILKLRYGAARMSAVDPEEIIDVPDLSGRGTNRHKRAYLTNVIEHGVRAALQTISKEIREAGFEDRFPGGVVLTGGTAALHDILAVAYEELLKTARVGIPEVSGRFRASDFEGPRYATVCGLLKNAHAAYVTGRMEKKKKSVVGHMKDWLLKNF